MLDSDGTIIESTAYVSLTSSGASAVLRAAEIELARLHLIKGSKEDIATLRELHESARNSLNYIMNREDQEIKRREQEGLTEAQIAKGAK